MQYQVEAACYCHIGSVRQNNEDNLYFNGRILPQENSGLRRPEQIRISADAQTASFGVFDGIGGEEDGQIASFLAASTLKEECANLNEYLISAKTFLEHTVQRMNERVWNKASASFNRMGTTMVLLHFRQEDVYMCNVGDSKAYRLRKNELLQISKDHTDAELLEKCGVVGRKPRLNQYVGISPEEMLLEPTVLKGKVKPGDEYLLCSDGLTDMLDTVEICSILKEAGSVKDAAERLVDEAVKRGGKDNVTVIVTEIREEK